jgi:hypothetical protein
VLECHGLRLVLKSLGQGEEGVQRKSPEGTILVKSWRAQPSRCEAAILAARGKNC